MIRVNEFSKYFRGAWLMRKALCFVNAEARSPLAEPQKRDRANTTLE